MVSEYDMYAYARNDPVNARDPSGCSATWNCASIRNNYYSCARCCHASWRHCRSCINPFTGYGRICIEDGFFECYDFITGCDGYGIPIDMTYCYDSYIFCLENCANRFLPPGETPI